MEAVDELEAFFDAGRVIVRLILDRGADAARGGEAVRTALHYAAGAGGQAVNL